MCQCTTSKVDFSNVPDELTLMNVSRLMRSIGSSQEVRYSCVLYPLDIGKQWEKRALYCALHNVWFNVVTIFQPSVVRWLKTSEHVALLWPAYAAQCCNIGVFY